MFQGDAHGRIQEEGESLPTGLVASVFRLFVVSIEISFKCFVLVVYEKKGQSHEYSLANYAPPP